MAFLITRCSCLTITFKASNQAIGWGRVCHAETSSRAASVSFENSAGDITPYISSDCACLIVNCGPFQLKAYLAGKMRTWKNALPVLRSSVAAASLARQSSDIATTFNRFNRL